MIHFKALSHHLCGKTNKYHETHHSQWEIRSIFKPHASKYISSYAASPNFISQTNYHIYQGHYNNNQTKHYASIYCSSISTMFHRLTTAMMHCLTQRRTCTIFRETSAYSGTHEKSGHIARAMRSSVLTSLKREPWLLSAESSHIKFGNIWRSNKESTPLTTPSLPTVLCNIVAASVPMSVRQGTGVTK
jgi:hypothetical protein